MSFGKIKIKNEEPITEELKAAARRTWQGKRIRSRGGLRVGKE